MSKRNSLYKSFIFIGKFGIPAVVIVLFVSSVKESRHIFFLLFMSAHCIARVWETFYTTKERKVDEFHGDWTLAWATIAYIVLCFAVIFEFYFSVGHLNYFVTTVGLGMYLFAIFMRWSGVRALGKQWAIHALGAQKIKKVRLIKLGVYKYIRHPIYLGIIFEVASIPIISNAYLSFLFCCCVNIPLQLVRMKLEEKNNVRKLGAEYEKYMHEVNALIPFKFITKQLLKHDSR